MSGKVELKDLLKTDSGLSVNQIQKFFTETPANKVKTRPAKGGGEWKYVSGSYVTQVLNSLFAYDWNFTVTTSMDEALKTAQTGTIVLQGRLEVRIGERYIVKEQYGRKEVAYKKGTRDLLDFGNDMKAAATDAKKKCASELGLFADVYSQEDFFEATVIEQSDSLDIIKKFEAAKSAEDIEILIATLSPSDQKSFATIAKSRLKEIRDADKS